MPLKLHLAAQILSRSCLWDGQNIKGLDPVDIPIRWMASNGMASVLWMPMLVRNLQRVSFNGA